MLTNCRTIVCCIITFFCALGTGAQAQSVDTLKEVKVTGKKEATGDIKANNFAPGQMLVTIDSSILKQYQMQSMASLLSQQASVFVKAYSFNGLATLNFRGASAAQSQVLWNGVPIQNAALGMADVSELPVMFMSKVSMEYGGSAALWGSGNVGGVLLLENASPVFDSGRKAFSLAGGAGSFGQYSLGLEAAASGKKWYVSLKGIGQTAMNNFSYTDAAGQRELMPNSSLQSGSGLLNAAYKVDAQNTVTFSAWYQKYDREIPPALFEAFSVKIQDDASLRLLLDWNDNAKSGAWYAKSSLIRDDTRYDDNSVLLHTTATAYQYYQEAGYRKRWKKYGQLLVFIPLQAAWMKLPDSNATKQQTRIAIATAYDIKVFRSRLNLAVNARLENEHINSFLLPGADGSYTLNPWLALKGNVQRTYRVPTLNELFYVPGGNPDLKPEQGWSEDAGYGLHLARGNCSFQQDVSGFNRNIHDWIIWLGGAIWTPHNIAEVHSRGIETVNKMEYTIDERWKLHLSVNTSYVLATTQSSYIPNDGSIGKQIQYMPRYNGDANIGFTFKKLYVNYNQAYTGYRFTVSDESEFLLPYSTGNIQAMYNTTAIKHVVQLTAQCNNIWNEQYTIIAYRPMPGINWLAGFRYFL